jgi:hypothetical protein
MDDSERVILDEISSKSTNLISSGKVLNEINQRKKMHNKCKIFENNKNKQYF